MRFSHLLGWGALLGACGGGHHGGSVDAAQDTASPDAGPFSGVIGPAGGTLAMPGGPTLVFPAGAVDRDTTITITRTTDVEPGAVTPVYALTPDGIVFAKPITATLAGTGSIYWSKHLASGFERVGGTATADSIAARQVHFSGLYAGPAAGNRTVSGSQVRTYLRATGITNQPFDLSALAPRILVPDGSGGYTTITGTGLSDGSFSIPEVPDGTYVLVLGNQLYVTSSEAFDAGALTIGRPDAVPVTQSTTISLNGTGLDPWDPNDTLEAYSSEVDMWWFDLGSQLAPAANATTVTGSFDSLSALTSSAYYGIIGPSKYLIDGSHGDQLTFGQLHTHQTTAGVSYVALSKVFTPAPFTQTDGGTSSLQGAFTDAPAGGTATLDFRITQFASAAGFDGTHCAALNPNAVPLVASAGIVAEPITKDYGAFGANADLLFLTRTVGDPDTVAANATYGLPPTGTWSPMEDAAVACNARIQLPGKNPSPFIVSVGITDDVTALAQPIVPRIGPVRTPTIAGLDLFQAQTGFGATPRIAWQAPSLGAPTHYAVAFWQLSAPGVNTKRTLAFQISTADTHVDVPPGFLQVGTPYVVEIRADDAPDVTAPNRTKLVGASANILSAIVTP